MYSIFDEKYHFCKPVNFLRKPKDADLALLARKPAYSSVFLVRIGTKTKNMTLKLYDKRLCFFKAGKVKGFIDFEEVFHLERVLEPDSKVWLVLKKCSTRIGLLALEETQQTELFRHIHKLCLLEDFNSEYELREVLGKGSFGCVRLAKRKTNSGRFAAKLIPKKQESFANFKEYLKNEIKLGMFLPDSKYLVKIEEVYESEEEIVIVQELMTGGDLHGKIKAAGKIPETQAFSHFLQIYKGLLFLNSHGFVHRDLKPENIMFTSNSEAKIGDFTLAELFTPELQGYCGTPGYMAPEIFTQKTYCENVDVFSLGVVLFSMYFLKILRFIQIFPLV